MSTKNALRSHDGCDDLRLHDTRNLTVLDQFQKVYLFLLMTSFGNIEKRPEGQLRNLNFASSMCYPCAILDMCGSSEVLGRTK